MNKSSECGQFKGLALHDFNHVSETLICALSEGPRICCSPTFNARSIDNVSSMCPPIRARPIMDIRFISGGLNLKLVMFSTRFDRCRSVFAYGFMLFCSVGRKIRTLPVMSYSSRGLKSSFVWFLPRRFVCTSLVLNG